MCVTAHTYNTLKDWVQFFELGSLLLGGCSKVLLYALLEKLLMLNINYRLKPSHVCLFHEKNEHLNKPHMTSQFNELCR